MTVYRSSGVRHFPGASPISPALEQAWILDPDAKGTFQEWLQENFHEATCSICKEKWLIPNSYDVVDCLRCGAGTYAPPRVQPTAGGTALDVQLREGH